MFLPATSLYTDITNAKALFVQKRDHFQSLSLIYSDRVAVWNQEDHQRRFLNKKKEIECVYRHNPGKGERTCLTPFC
jgi:3-methyladenine DNA glycosylase Mpg